MDLDVESTITDDGIVVLTIKGSMDLTTAPGLRDSLIRRIDQGHNRLVLELRGVDLIDSIGLGVIVGLVHRLRPHDGSLAIAAPSRQARTVLEITQLVRIVTPYDTIEAALGAVRSGGAAVSAVPRPDQRAAAG
jgi:anti-sigma B factor antagonist